MWPVAPIESLTEPDSPITYGVIKPGGEGSVRFVRGGDIADGIIREEALRTISADVSEQYKRTLLRGGELLMCLVGQPGQVAVASANLIGANIARQVGLIRLRLTVDANFVSYFLRSPEGVARLGKSTGGSVQQVINLSDLRQVRVPIPPLNEQRRIVAILDEAFEGIATAKENAEKNLQNARELFESYLGVKFEQHGEVVQLSRCATHISDGDHAPPPKSPTGVPFITISNVHKETRRIDFSNTFTVSREYFEGLKPHRKPKRGDVLYTVTGSFGIPVLVENEGEFCFQRHIGLVRPKPDVDSRWLMYALLSPQVRAQAEAGATGTAQRTVSLGVLRAMTIPKLDVQEQCQIAAQIDALSDEVGRLKDIARAKCAALDELKSSLLHQAFTGALTDVSVDRQVVEVT
jgi:type I restriction enzyme S subunit